MGIYGDKIITEGFFKKTPEEKARKELAKKVKDNVMGYLHDHDLYDITGIMAPTGSFQSGKTNELKMTFSSTQSLANAANGYGNDRETRAIEQKLKYILSKANDIAKYLEDNISDHKFKCEKAGISGFSLKITVD